MTAPATGATALTVPDIDALRRAHGITLRCTDRQSLVIAWVRGGNHDGVPTYKAAQHRLFPLRDRSTGMIRYRPINAGLNLGGTTADAQPWNLTTHPATICEHTVTDAQRQAEWDTITAHGRLRAGMRLIVRWTSSIPAALAVHGYVRDEVRLIVRDTGSNGAREQTYLLHVHVGPAETRLIHPRVNDLGLLGRPHELDPTQAVAGLTTE